MKSYLLLPLLFLGVLCLPMFILSQEGQHSQTSEAPYTHSPTNEHPDGHETKNYLDHELPGTWPDHGTHEADTFQSKFFNMLFVLGLLIGFMILASWALKRMMRAKMTNLNTASTIKVLETRHLSPRATLYLIEVQGQSVLIAESPTHVTYLTTFPLQEEEPSPSSQSLRPPPFPGPLKKVPSQF